MLSSVGWLTTLRDNLSVLSSRVNQSWALKIGPVGCSESSATTNQCCVTSKKIEGLKRAYLCNGDAVCLLWGVNCIFICYLGEGFALKYETSLRRREWLWNNLTSSLGLTDAKDWLAGMLYITPLCVCIRQLNVPSILFCYCETLSGWSFDASLFYECHIAAVETRLLVGGGWSSRVVELLKCLKIKGAEWVIWNFTLV
jgi:hypothetical protein